MVVDDNQGLLTWLEQELKAAGFQPVVFAALQDATQALDKIRPDAAVIDVMLPDGNGVHLAVQLRKRFARLPVVVMSGMALHTEEAGDLRQLRLPDALQAVPRAGRQERAAGAAAARRRRAREVGDDLSLGVHFALTTAPPRCAAGRFEPGQRGTPAGLNGTAPLTERVGRTLQVRLRCPSPAELRDTT